MRASVITPTFNAAAHIDQCIRNVVAQGDVVLEHVIVDGGSTDGTVEKVHEMMKSHPHLRILYGPDRGQSDAMNKGSVAARGEVIAILNVDDYYQPDAIREGVAILDKAEVPTLIVGTCKIIDTFHDVEIWNKPTQMAPEYLFQNSPNFPLPANPSAYFYHREVHDIVGGYDVDDSYAMDAEFVLTCSEKVNCRFVDRYWGNFCLIPGCKTYENISNGEHLVAKLISRHKRALGLKGRIRLGVRTLKARAHFTIWRGLKSVGLR